jgi:ATP-dependent RNA helicase RhlE
LTTFSDLGLAEVILRAVAEEGYTIPTPIQQNVIPAMMEGHDVLGVAQTGTGKTAAFVLPILNSLVANKERPAERSCKALILAPTRELANQIGQCIRDYGRFMRPSVAVIVGGAAQGPQIRALSRGVDVVVATPGRLLDHLGTGAVKLFGTHVVVMDEADQMLDMGFIPAIRRIMALLPVKRQTVLLSATMPPAIRGLPMTFYGVPKRSPWPPSPAQSNGLSSGSC